MPHGHMLLGSFPAPGSEFHVIKSGSATVSVSEDVGPLLCHESALENELGPPARCPFSPLFGRECFCLLK